MTKLPKPDASVETLKTATAVKEAISDGDANTMIEEGFVLVGVSPQKKDGDHPFRYTLIWPRPLAQMPQRVRARLHL